MQQAAWAYRAFLKSLLLCASLLMGQPFDENLEMGETTVRVTVQHFCDTVVADFGPEYLRQPTPTEIQALLEQIAKRGFAGMTGSIDCMHWIWKNIPMATAGQPKGKDKKPTKVLETVADYKLHSWHCNSDSPGSLNDLNILEQSPIFDSFLRGDSTTVHYEINGHSYDTPYLLSEGIYPNWSVFVKSIENRLGLKFQHYATKQEAYRKDVERCFGVVSARWCILDVPCRIWSVRTMETVMKARVIMHHMIVEDENDIFSQDQHAYLFGAQPGGVPVLAISRPPPFTDITSVETVILRTVKFHDQ